MKKFFRSLKTWVLVVCTILLAIIAIFSVRILVDTAKYSSYCLILSDIEQKAEKGTGTRYGIVTWTDDLRNYYAEVSAKKAAFVEDNDTASYLYYSGYSMMGKIVRIFSTFAFVYVTYLCIKLIKVILKIIVRRMQKSINKRRNYAQ